MRSPEKVSEDIRHWMANGFQAIYFPFSPPGTEEYYIQLFDLLESKKIVPDSVYLEYFDGLPSRAFLSRFSEVSQDATLVLSPASAVEDVRIAHKLPDYTNRKMENYFYLAEKRNVKIEMYFSMLPNDTVKTLERTMNWIIRLRKYYNAGCKIALIEIEPGSDWFENPGKYNLKLLRTSLKDFVKHHGSGAPAGLSEKLGYAIADEEEKMEIIRQISYICLL